jgi:hypothetical protein
MTITARGADGKHLFGIGIDDERAFVVRWSSDEHTFGRRGRFPAVATAKGALMAIAVLSDGPGRPGPRPTLRLAELSVVRPVGLPAASPAGEWARELRRCPQEGLLGEATAPRAPLRRTRRPSASAAVRRRIALALVVGSLLVLLALPVRALGGRPLAGHAVPLRAGTQYVVQPGDTLWSIATRLDPNGDPRPVVARLVAETGSEAVVAGERIRLP